MIKYLAIDNGSTGQWCIYLEGSVPIVFNPIIKKQLNYTKKAANITRIDVLKTVDLLSEHIVYGENIKVIMERPLVNPGQFVATSSALRAFEATLIILEIMNLGLYQYIDSKQWQSKMLPKGIKGSSDLKKASLEIGCRLYPKMTDQLVKHKDADGLLMAVWALNERI